MSNSTGPRRSNESNAQKGTQSTHSRADVAVATVVSVLHACAVVEMPDGQAASLAWKEIWPTFRMHDRVGDFRVIEDVYAGINVVRAKPANTDSLDASSREIVIGDRILVAPCGHSFGRGYRASVSHVRAYDNPWDNVAKWKDKEIKSFIVESVTDKYVWGTINPSIRARVSIESLDMLLPNEPWHGHQFPLRGDEIAGWFFCANVDDREQIVTLAYADYVKSPLTVQEVFHSTTSVKQSPQVNATNDAPPLLSSLASYLRIRTLLLLDDDPDFLRSLSQYLRDQCGITVLSCKDDKSAISAINTIGVDIDLVIIDINLGTADYETKDHHGLHVARYLQERFPKCPIVLTTGEEINPLHPSMIVEPMLCIHDIVYKPFGTDSLYRALDAVGKPAYPLSDLHTHTSDISSYIAESHTTELQEVLEDLRDSLAAEAAGLFRICPITDDVCIVTIAGSQTKYNDNKERLAWSPIRDAAMSDEIIFTRDATHPLACAKHRYLLRAYNYRSCVGVPVKTGGADYYAYALFAFHPEAGRFIDAAEFTANEFKGQFTTHELLSAIKAVHVEIPDAPTELEQLNQLLWGPSLHERFGAVVLPKDAMAQVGRALNLEERERVRLNRVILEAACPLECPRAQYKETHPLRLAKHAARQIGLILKIRKLEEEIRQMKPFEMMGQAYGSMAHDLSRDLSSGFLLDEISANFASGDKNSAAASLAAAKSRLQHAQQIVRSFRDMARGQHEEVALFPAKPAITDVIVRLQGELRDYHTSLTLLGNINDDVALRMRRSSLDQLLTNIVLNAAQQIDRLPQSFARGVAEFTANEFKGQFTTHELLSAIKAVHVEIPDAPTELEQLNQLLWGPSLHERFGAVVLPKDAMAQVGRALNLEERERVRLNRVILEAACPLECPKNHTWKGEVCVTISSECDSLGVSWLVFQIVDNGPGIHRRDFNRVFDLHYTTKEQGCGMGLDICRKIVAGVTFGNVCGTVQVKRSVLLSGTAFELRLPTSQKGITS